MTKEQLTALGLTDEQAEKAIGLYSEEMKGFVPRSRLQEETDKIAGLQKQLSDRDKDIKTLQSAAGKGSELEKQLFELQGKYKADTEALNRQIAQTKLNAALDAAILKEKGKNPKAIKALIDAEKLKLKDDGTIDGLDLAALKTSDPYLFEIETTTVEGTGGAGGGDGSGGKADLSKMTYTELAAYMAANPGIKI